MLNKKRQAAFRAAYEVCGNITAAAKASVNTPKPAIRDHLKTGQRGLMQDYGFCFTMAPSFRQPTAASNRRIAEEDN